MTLKQYFISFLKEKHSFEYFMKLCRQYSIIMNTPLQKHIRNIMDYLYDPLFYFTGITITMDFIKIRSEWIDKMKVRAQYMFENFLLENNLYNEFMEEYSKSHNKEPIKRFYMHTTPNMYFVYAFEWQRSSQGQEYWQHFDLLWKKQFYESFNGNSKI